MRKIISLLVLFPDLNLHAWEVLTISPDLAGGGVWGLNPTRGNIGRGPQTAGTPASGQSLPNAKFEKGYYIIDV